MPTMANSGKLYFEIEASLLRFLLESRLGEPLPNHNDSPAKQIEQIRDMEGVCEEASR